MGQMKADEQELYIDDVLSNFNTSKTSGEPAAEDIETGFDLFHAVVFCTPTIVVKTYTMIDQLLSVETSRTIIQTVVNLFQSGVITDEATFTMTRQFYQVLADTLDLQYGNILWAMSTTAQMNAVIWNRWPFFTNFTRLVQNCLQQSDCGTLQDIYQHLGKSICFFSS